MKKIVFFLFIFNTTFCISQTKKIDSLQNFINTCANDSVVMMTYSKLRRLTIYKDVDKANFYNEKYIEIAKKRKDSFRIALGEMYFGNIEVTKNNFKKALKHFFKAANYFEKKQDSFQISSTFNGIGAVFINSDNDSLALKYFKKSQKISSSLGDLRRSAIALNNISEIYSKNNELQLAKKTLEQAHTEILKTNKNQYKILVSINLANLYTNLHEYPKSINLLTETLSKIDTIKDNYNHALIYKSFGELYINLAKNKKALWYLNQSYKKFKSYNYSDEVYKILPNLITALKSNGDYKKALELFSEYNIVKDSVFSTEKHKNLLHTITKYETLKKEAQLKVLTLESEKNEQKKWLFFYLALTSLLITFLVVYFLYKNNIKNQQISKTLSEKEILLKEIHHRVKNNLQVVSSLLNLQQRNLKDKNTILLFQESSNRIKAMSLIHQNLYQNNDLASVNITKYITNLVSNLITNYQTSNTKIKINTQIENLKLDIDTIISIGLIINELVSNTLKYAFTDNIKNKIDVLLFKKNNYIYLEVKDNGKGMGTNFNFEKSKSLGFKLITAFTKKLEGELKIESDTKGTSIKIKFPA